MTLSLGLFINEMRCRVRVTGVVTGGVGVPDVNEDVRDRFTCLDVDDTNVHDLNPTSQLDAQ